MNQRKQPTSIPFPSDLPVFRIPRDSTPTPTRPHFAPESSYILRHLPPGIDYVGFDIDQAYIEQARRAFGHLGQFHCR
jgi:hypothetical protein